MSIGKRLVLFLLSSLLMVVLPVGSIYADVTAAGQEQLSASLASSYGKLPIVFEANEGQTDPAVRYLARGHGYTLFMTVKEFVLSLSSVDGDSKDDTVKTESVRIKFLNPGASDSRKITGIGELSGKSNYFIGNDPRKWHTDVPTYEKVKYSGMY